MPKCKLRKLKNGKLYCNTHKQSLMYIYADLVKDNRINEALIICQVGEDELIDKGISPHTHNSRKTQSAYMKSQ